MVKEITIDDLLMGRIKFEALSDVCKSNALTLLERVNKLLSKFGETRKVNSGYRSPDINKKTPGAALKSKHMICAAIDLEDVNAKLNKFCKDNLTLLEEIGLWCEERQGGWQHLQMLPPKSGKRFFIP